MTGGLLVASYLLTLALFLGLDVVKKVPPTLYLSLATAMGAAAALAVAVAVPAAGASREGLPAYLSVGAVALATAGVIGGLLRARQLLRDKGGRR